ncbi:hypothetical protein DPMN_187955 [Dreissena polymorpha]|uniref:Transposase n=1 Tax=Dreissena polymorpha TaxID=45954 RepID=A0A9D4DS13_DREPO|nr:hypothetical protein DPMN_187955 [Dreissena polymorpha]
MKRKREDLTLWDAAHVHKHKSMWYWWEYIRRKDMVNHEKTDCDVIQLLQSASVKKQKTQSDKFFTSFSVGIRPTKHQKRVLNEMLRVSNYTYNWCLWLVNEKGIEPHQFELQKIVCKTNANDVDPQYRMENDDWFFNNKMTSVKTTSCKNFYTSYKAAKSLKSKLKRPMSVSNIVQGSFCVPKLFVRNLSSKDVSIDNINMLNRYICMIPENFEKRSKPKERFLKLAKPITKIPPFDHDVKIVKRADGMFILNIPCDPKYTRRNASNDTIDKRVCGIDPGGRTFATVYDPIDCSVFQVGIEEDKQYVISKLHNKIYHAHKHLTKAQNKKQQQAASERIVSLKKTHLKLKTFVDDIHLKLSSHLVKEYEYVALGKINVAQLVKTDRPKPLSPRAKRDLLYWQHYRFRQRLTHRTTNTECILDVQNEAYTSKTCGVCGTINKNLEKSETFFCDQCKYNTHRDVNGARNILLKSLRMFPFEKQQQ